MTVANQTKKVTALGNGVTTVFSFSPMVLPDDSTQLVVTKVDDEGVETVLTEGTGTANYSVTVSSYPGTGSITYPASGTANILATGESIVMKRVLTLEQETDLENQGGYFPDVQEQQFDRLVMIDLQQQDEIDRAPKFVVGADLSSFDNEMAAPVASKMPVVNSAGTGWEWVDTPAAAVIATAAAQAAAEAAQAAAELAQAAAETAETNAETAETNAEASETAAAASAAAAAAAAGSNLFNTIASKSSDYTVVANTDDGTLFQVDSSSGNVALTLPSIATALEGERYGVYRVSASNTVTLVRNGTDTINGVAGTYTVNAVAGELVVIVADEASPNNWVVFVWSQAIADEITLTKVGSTLSINTATLQRIDQEVIVIAVSDESTALTTGTAKVTFFMPFAMTLTEVFTSVSTQSSSGVVTVDVNEADTTIFTTPPSIDANEGTSRTGTAAVLSDTALANSAKITIDIDAAGTGAKGLKVYLIGRRA